MTSACNNFQHYWFYQLVASFVLVLIPMGNVSAQPGTLTFVEYVKDDSNGVDGLNGASEKVISPDGNYLYVASLNDSSVAVFARNSSTGALTFLEIHKDDSAGVDGLAGALGMSMNSEGTHLYIASHQDSAIAVFSRNAGSGLLTFIEQVKDDSNGVDGIAWIHTVRVSPDGLHVYAPGYVENELAIFSRNFSDGTLTFIEKIKDDSAGVDGLWNSADLTFSPDGGYVYVTARSDASIATFQRSASTGLLTFVEVQKNDSAGVSGLASVNGVKLSPDGKHVYVAGSGDSSLVVFSRNSSTGALTYVRNSKMTAQG